MPSEGPPVAIQPMLLSNSLGQRNVKQVFDLPNLFPLRSICWAILLIAGLVQTWYTRHRVFSDGVSYLSIARYYAVGDWHSALNSYWSPLYSWLLATLMLIVHPSSYWEVGLMHFLNLLAYVVALVGFELFLYRLIRFQQNLTAGRGVNEQSIRIVGYSTFLISTLLLIGIGYNSPDMVALCIGLFIGWVLLRIEAEPVRLSAYILLGCLLGLEYLTRSAFALFIPFYLVVVAALLWLKKRPKVLLPVLFSGLVALVICAPFVTALSISKGRFTLGDAGKLNYGWEVDGAARSTHWQGEPNDIGKPTHPTNRVLSYPATYTFASPVPGSYPPWYEPSYWYAGITPHLKLKPQLLVLRGSIRYLLLLFLLCSAIPLAACTLVFFMGWRRWLSLQGILAYWFLLLPAAAYIAPFTLVYLDKRYVAGSLLVIWMCLLASIQMNDPAIRAKANAALQVVSVLLGVGFLLAKLGAPTLYAVQDLSHRKESERNLNWVIANKLEQAGFLPGDHIAVIGQTIDAEWASIARVKIVAEIPVIWDRKENLFRSISVNETQVKAFWSSSPETQAKVFEAFRKAGATFVVAEQVPPGHESHWIQLLPRGIQGLPRNEGQYDTWAAISYMRLYPAGSAPTTRP